MDGRVEPKTTDGDLEGLDESQRAEVHEYEGGGPTDGVILTDMARDHGEDFVQDDRASEIMPEAVDAVGMSIIDPDEIADDGAETELVADLDDDEEL